MNVFPATPEPGFPFDEELSNRTLISDFDSGKEQRRNTWAFPKYNVSLKYNALLQSDVDILWNFYKQQNGATDPFWFFYPFLQDIEDKYVGLGDGTTRSFELPGKNIVGDSSFKTYVDGVEQTTSSFGWIVNGGFETGDFTGWDAGGGVIDTVTVRSGTYSCKIDANGTTAPINDIVVDETRKYIFDTWCNIPSFTSGSYYCVVWFMDAESGGSVLGTAPIFTYTAATSGWTQAQKTMGPSSSSPDFVFPTGTKTILIFTIHTGTLTAYIDDFSLTIDGYTNKCLLLSGWGDAGSDKVYFQADSVPGSGAVITTDFTGTLKLKCRFKENNLSRNLFTKSIFSSGIPLKEILL